MCFSLEACFWKSRGYHSPLPGQASKAIKKLILSKKYYMNLPFFFTTRSLNKTRNYNRKSSDNNNLMNLNIINIHYRVL